MVMDKVWLALCFGLKEREDGFINTYTCLLPASTGDAGLSERNKNKADMLRFCFVLCLHTVSMVRVTFSRVSSSGCWNIVPGSCHLVLIIGV